MTEKCDWPLGDGRHLKFDVFTQHTNWYRVAGIYIFAYWQETAWTPVYVGETEDFSLRLPHHERLDEAGRLGATHIHAAVVSQETERKLLERTLIQYLQPPLNTQYRSLAS